MSIIYSNGSITHTFGNVACLAMNYVKRFFPEDFFNVSHISTKLAYRQLDVFKTNKEFWKLHKPILILRPRIEMDDNSKYFYGSAFMNKMHNVTSPAEYANRVDLMTDKEGGTAIQFIWNRYKIYYDVVIIVDTYNEQLNLANHIMNSIVPNTPFMINTPLESYIPNCLIDGISKFINISPNETGRIVSYLNHYGKTPFTYKFKNGSGNKEYFSLYNTNVEMIASDLSLDDGNQRGMITDAYTVAFTLSCEFNSMGAYYLLLRDNIDKLTPYIPDNLQSDNRVVPLYSIPLLFELPLDAGWLIASAPTYTVNPKDVDITDITDVITPIIGGVIKYQQALLLPQDLFVKFKVFKGYKELPYGDKGFEVDLSDAKHPVLKTYDLDEYETYRLFVLINNEYINSLNAEIAEFNEEK